MRNGDSLIRCKKMMLEDFISNPPVCGFRRCHVVPMNPPCEQYDKGLAVYMKHLLTPITLANAFKAAYAPISKLHAALFEE